MNNRQLKNRFLAYNIKYFDGKLLNSTVVVFGKTRLNADGNYDFNENKVTISQALQDHDALALICLLHEMAHAKLRPTYVGEVGSKDPDHGMIYQAELVRLFHAGAYDGLL